MSARRRSSGSVTKKGRRWYAVLTIGRTTTGNQQRHWSNGFNTRREAEKHLAQLLIEEHVRIKTRETVGSVVTRYIDNDVSSRGRRSPTTTARYRGLLKNMGPVLNVRVDKISASEIEGLYSALLSRGLSQTTIHHVHNLLYAALTWGSRKAIGLVTNNPFVREDICKPRRLKGGARSFTVAQALALIDELAKTKHANPLIFALATGCRRGEVCGLKWSSVDFARKVAIMRESRFQVRGIVGQKSTKADRIREIPLNRTALSALEAQRNRTRHSQALAGDTWVHSDHVFVDEFGAPLSPMALTNAFSRCAKRAGAPSTRMHDLRHTAATFMLSGGGNTAATAQILGHSEKSTTLRIYGHVIGMDEIRAIRSIDRALARAQSTG
jgi:integrase